MTVPARLARAIRPLSSAPPFAHQTVAQQTVVQETTARPVGVARCTAGIDLLDGSDLNVITTDPRSQGRRAQGVHVLALGEVAFAVGILVRDDVRGERLSLGDEQRTRRCRRVGLLDLEAVRELARLREGQRTDLDGGGASEPRLLIGAERDAQTERLGALELAYQHLAGDDREARRERRR